MISSPIKRSLIQLTLTFVLVIDNTLATIQVDVIQSILLPTEWCNKKFGTMEDKIINEFLELCNEALESFKVFDVPEQKFVISAEKKNVEDMCNEALEPFKAKKKSIVNPINNYFNDSNLPVKKYVFKVPELTENIDFENEKKIVEKLCNEALEPFKAISKEPKGFEAPKQNEKKIVKKCNEAFVSFKDEKKIVENTGEAEKDFIDAIIVLDKAVNELRKAYDNKNETKQYYDTAKDAKDKISNVMTKQNKHKMIRKAITYCTETENANIEANREYTKAFKTYCDDYLVYTIVLNLLISALKQEYSQYVNTNKMMTNKEP